MSLSLNQQQSLGTIRSDSEDVAMKIVPISPATLLLVGIYSTFSCCEDQYCHFYDLSEGLYALQIATDLFVNSTWHSTDYSLEATGKYDWFHFTEEIRWNGRYDYAATAQVETSNWGATLWHRASIIIGLRRSATVKVVGDTATASCGANAVCAPQLASIIENVVSSALSNYVHVIVGVAGYGQIARSLPVNAHPVMLNCWQTWRIYSANVVPTILREYLFSDNPDRWCSSWSWQRPSSHVSSVIIPSGI